MEEVMKRFWLIPLVLAVFLVAVSAAKADSVALSFSGSGISGSGTLSVYSIGSGQYEISGGSLLINGLTANVVPDPKAPNDNTIKTGDKDAYHPTESDEFDYDNILEPGSTSSIVDSDGLLFQFSDGTYFEMYSLSSNHYYWNELTITNNIGNAPADPINSPFGLPVSMLNATLDPTPEPSSLMLLGTGLLLLAGLLFWRSRRSLVQTA
jgi:hypothetical protein